MGYSQRINRKGLQVEYFKDGNSEDGDSHNEDSQDEDSQDEATYDVFPSHYYMFSSHYQNDECFTSGNIFGDPLKNDLEESPIYLQACSSHEIAHVIFRRALMKYPSVTELIVLLKLILHGVVRQVEEIKQLQSKGLEHFHHILPVCLAGDLF